MEFGWLFTNLLGLAGTGYGWLNPFFGLMIFYMFSILKPTWLWFWVDYPTQRYSLFIGLSMLIGWFMQGMGNWSNIRGVRWPLFGLIVYLIAGAIAAQFCSIYAPRAWDAWFLQFKIILMTVITISVVREPKQIKIFAWTITASLIYLGWVFNSQYYFDGWNRILIHGFGGIDNNGAAMIMAMGVPLAFFMGIHDKRMWVKATCFAGAFLAIHVVLFSFSRGAFLGLCIMGLMIFVIAITHLPRKGITVFVAIVFVALSLHFAGQEVRQEFASIFVDAEERDASAQSRFVTWNGAWQCMLDHPLGVGPRNFNLISTQYGLARNKSVHNLYLQTGADYGFIGMFGLTAFYFGTLWSTYRMSISSTAKELVWPRYFGFMICIALSGLLVCSTFIGMESVETGFIISILGLCTIAHVNRIADSPSDPKKQSVLELDEVPLPDLDQQLVPA